MQSLIVCQMFDNPNADIQLQITRSNKRIQNGWIWTPQLSPSWNLFSKTLYWKDKGQWPQKYPEYRELFQQEMQHRTAQKYIGRIIERLQEGKTVALGCYCTDKYCHRFLVQEAVKFQLEKGLQS